MHSSHVPLEVSYEALAKVSHARCRSMSIVLQLAAESVWKRGRRTSDNLPVGIRVQISQISEQLSSGEYALTLHQEPLCLRNLASGIHEPGRSTPLPASAVAQPTVSCYSTGVSLPSRVSRGSIPLCAHLAMQSGHSIPGCARVEQERKDMRVWVTGGVPPE